MKKKEEQFKVIVQDESFRLSAKADQVNKNCSCDPCECGTGGCDCGCCAEGSCC